MKKLILFLALIIAFTSSLSSQNKEIDSLLNAFFKKNNPGGSVLVAKGEKVIYQKNFGKANLALNIDVNTNHIFELASVTKPITAIAILKLVDQGKLSLTDAFTKYIDDYPKTNKKITIEHLLTHTSGIYNYNDDMVTYMNTIQKRSYTQKEFINLFKDKPLNFSPGKKYAYNNSAYFLLGCVIEKVSGLTYYEFLKKHIFIPLEMENTFLNNSNRIIPNLVSGYETNKKSFKNARCVNKSSHYSQGGIVSTPKDMFLLYKALFNHKIISKSLLEKAINPYILNNGTRNRTSYGFFIGNLLGSPFITHDGRLLGATSSFIYLPNEKIFAIVVSNCSWYGYGSGIAYFPHKIASILIKKKYFNNTINDNLKSFQGDYVSNVNEKKHLLFKNNNLYLKQKNGWISKLSYYKNNTFFVEDSYETVQFNTKKNLISSIGNNRVVFQKTN